jgi:16S rRNA U516 pseudouridylate synthase RsuA-like enzyme
VQSLRRIRFGPLSDSGLRPGEWRDLSEVEVEKLKKWKSGKVSIEVERGRRRVRGDR